MAMRHGRLLAMGVVLAAAIGAAAGQACAATAVVLPGVGGDAFVTGVVGGVGGAMAVGYLVTPDGGDLPQMWSYSGGTVTGVPVTVPGTYVGGQITAVRGSTMLGWVYTGESAAFATTWDAGSPNDSLAALTTPGSEILPIALATNGAVHVGTVAPLAHPSDTTAEVWVGGVGTSLSLTGLSGLTGPTAATAVTTAGEIGGWATVDGTPSASHAIVWSLVGGAWQAADVTAAGGEGAILGAEGSQFVGRVKGVTDTNRHALLWDATSPTAPPLLDTGYISSEATAIADGIVVGWGDNATDGMRHALAWLHGADSEPLDLGIPTGDYISSQATAVSNGWVAGWAADSVGGQVGVIWALPEPGTLGLVGLGAVAWWRRRRS